MGVWQCVPKTGDHIDAILSDPWATVTSVFPNIIGPSII